MPPPKREYNAVPAIADEIWQYRMGGNLTIFDKDHDTAEEGRSRTAEVLAAKHTASLQLLCTAGGNQARLDARSEFEISHPFDERSTSNLAWSPLNGCGYAQGLCLRELFWLARRISSELA
jgi:hypothetical protein